jgi:hypothetical protein
VKKFLLILSFILMPVIGFFVFNWWLSQQKADSYALIPANAFAVVCTHDFYSTWDSLQGGNVWKNLQGLSSLEKTDHKMNAVDSLFGGKQKAAAFFKGKKILISAHLTNANELDYLFFIPLSKDSDDDQTLKGLLGKITSDPSYQMEERKNEDISIQEITKKADSSFFNFIRYKNLLIAGSSGFLIDDVIRVIKGEANFLKANPQVKRPPHKEGENFVYFKYKNISGLASLFSDSSEIFKPLNKFADHSTVNVKMNQKEILLTGFSSPGDSGFLNVFKGQKPQKFNLKNYVPNNTASFYYFGFDDGVSLNESMVNYWKKSNPALIEDRKDIYQLYNIDVTTLFSDFQNEIGLSVLESEKPDKEAGRLLFIRSGDPQKCFLRMNKFVTLAKEDRSDTLFNEKYHGYLIREMNIPQFPHMLLGDFFNGFHKCYYAVIDDCMVLANDPRHMRQLVDNIDSENVWGKTAAINNMLENNFSSSNVSLFLNTEQAWKSMMHIASPDVKIQLQNNAEGLKQIHQVLLQYNVLNDKVFTNLIITHSLDNALQKEEEAYASDNQISMERGILSEPYLFLSKDQSKIILQDSAFQLYAVSDGIVKWSDTLGKEISGPVISVGMDKGGEAAYFGIAKNIIFAYETDGKTLTGFPIRLPDTTSLNTISVVDFDHSRNYRIIVSDLSGAIYMFDTKGKPVEGWKPVSLGGKLKHPVKHLRIKGKDVLVVLQEKGKLWALNNKGEFYKGFPLDLRTPSSNPVFIESDESSAENSYLTVLTDKGDLIKLDLKGIILKREAVSNMGAGASFKLCIDQEEKSYIIVSQRKNELSILNDKLDQLFETVLNSVNLDLRYYVNGDKMLLVIFDSDANLCYLLDDKGKNIFRSAVKATKPLKIGFKGKDIAIVKVNQYQLEEGVIK